ncbi:MAG: hypothetical protein ACI4PG_08785 [Candidatus Ventricola sp.]
MDNRGIRLAAALVMAVLLLLGGASAVADTADPIRVSSLSEPQSVISEQEVAITIKIYNSSQTDMLDTIVLYNPEGNSVEKYSGLKAEQSVTYTGAWRVTGDQIAKGRINYYITYTVDNQGTKTEMKRTVPVTIQTEAAAPQLTATYSISPVSAREGQSVTLSYTLSNTGNVELRNIVVENSGVSKEKLAQPSLSVGEKITLTDTFTMGSKELVSQPTITYQAAGASKTMTISDMARKTITVAEDGLEVELKAENTKNVYPGERLTLTLSMKNTGNTAYTALNATLSDGTSVASGVELAPGASLDRKVEWSAVQAGAISASVSGLDANGEEVGVVSNELEVTTQDASRALVLEIEADAQTDVIHTEPAVIRFGVVVRNVGQLDATNLTIEQAGKTVATIPSLPYGESRTIVFDLETSIAGQFQFVVKGKDADSNEKSYASNILKVSYVAPTPTPTAAPTPTPVPPTPSPVPTATPAPTLRDIIEAHVDPMVLYIAAGVLAALLAVILGVSGVRAAKRKRRMAQAIDTIELSPDVRNHRGRKRRGAPQTREPKPQQEPIVPATELTEEDAARLHEPSSTPARDAMRRLENEEGRRRAARAVPADETLRVAPVDQRPEFVAQGKVDDSKTRVFGRLAVEQAVQAEQDGREAAETEGLAHDAAAREEAVDAGAQAGETIRFSPEQAEALRRQEADPYAAQGRAGRKRSDIKPMKKKKRGLFGRKDDEDDFVEDGGADDGDDDLFE